jgi:hypothetical protein
VKPLLVVLGVLVVVLIGAAWLRFLALKDFFSQHGPKRPKGQSMTALAKNRRGRNHRPPVARRDHREALLDGHRHRSVPARVRGCTLGAWASTRRRRAAVTPTSKAASRRIGLLIAIASCVAMLAACTTTTGAMYRGYATEAKAGIQTWDDNAIATLKTSSARSRTRQSSATRRFSPASSALCGQLVNTASLDPTQVQQMLSIAKTLGLVPAPAAAAAK